MGYDLVSSPRKADSVVIRTGNLVERGGERDGEIPVSRRGLGECGAPPSRPSIVAAAGGPETLQSGGIESLPAVRDMTYP